MSLASLETWWAIAAIALVVNVIPIIVELRSRIADLEREAQVGFDLLKAIDARHQPRTVTWLTHGHTSVICAACRKPWPCPDHLTLHPDAL